MCLVRRIVAPALLVMLSSTVSFGAEEHAPAKPADPNEGATTTEESAAPSAPKTAEELEAAWTASPHDLRLGLQFYETACAAGESARVGRVFRRAEQAVGDNPVAAFLYARSTRRASGRKKMHALLQDGLGLPKDKRIELAPAWRALASDEVQARNWDGATVAAAGLVAARGLAEDFSYAGWIDERRGDLDAATQNYKRAIQVREDYVHAHLALSLILARAGKQAESLQIAQAVAAKVPDDASAHLHLGMVLCMAGRRSVGRKSYAKAVEVAGRNVATLVAVAEAYRKLEDLTAAEATLAKALDIDPTHTGALLGSAAVALDQNKPAEARTFIQSAEKNGLESALLFFLKGLALERLKIWSPALKAYKQASRLAPDNDNYTVAYAMAMHKKGSTSGAIRLLNKVLKQRPDDATLQFQVAYLQMSRKDYKAARKSLERVTKLKPDDPKPYFYLAVIIGDEMGKAKDALAALETYERLGGREPSALKWLAKLRAATGKK